MSNRQSGALRGERPQMGLFENGSGDSKEPASPPVPVVAATPAVAGAEGPKPAPPPRRVSAESLAQKQREISVSEFFVKNRHLLGFDNPQKALLTAVRECIDNSLDACGEAGILPTLRIEIAALAEDRFRIAVEDNGPGIVRKQIPRVFGKLLYGSKFHTLKQQRGQQGIGVSAAGMYGQLTTGKPVTITSRTGKGPAHLFEVTVDTKKNEPLILREDTREWDVKHGTRVEIELQALYKRGRRSVDDYVEQTALANPHAEIFYTAPGQETVHFPRAVKDLPEEPREIKPHPYGVELGMLLRMLQDSSARQLSAALKGDFSRVTDKVVAEVTKASHVRPTARPRDLSPGDVERLHKALQAAKIMAPPTNCLSPIGEEAIVAGLRKRVPQADYYEAVTRPPTVYRGNPFQVEVGLAYGGALPGDELIDLYRLANRVPLQYQSSACATTKAVISVDWRSYGLSMSKGALPTGPMVLMAHIASVWVPFTSESKEAIAHYPEIVKELRLALMDVGRRLGSHIRHRRRTDAEMKKRGYIDKFIPHIGIALRQILALSERQENKVVTTLRATLEKSRETLL